MSSKLLSEKGALDQLGIGRTKLFELTADGQIESVKIGRRRLWPLDAIDDYVAKLREGSV